MTQEVLDRQTLLTRVVGDVTGAAPGTIASDSHLVEFGVSSVQLLQIHAQLEDALGREIPATALFDHETIGALAAFLAT